MDDLLDLFGDRKASQEKKSAEVAPVELMAQFLLYVSERKMVEALSLTTEILSYEPNNSLILEYKRSLTIFIEQAEEEEDDSTESAEEESTDEVDDESGDEESDDSENEAYDSKSDRK